MNLFSESRLQARSEDLQALSQIQGPAQPLAGRMRPRRLDEFVGQPHLLGERGFLRRALEQEAQGRLGLGNMVLWGPPGSGKTTLALLLARETGRSFLQLSAVLDGLKELRNCLEKVRQLRNPEAYTPESARAPILFIDEIHRWNKSQQDALLPWVEQGHVLLVGASTENPAFELNNALLSRVRVVELAELGDEELKAILHRALADDERGLGRTRLRLQPEAVQYLLDHCGGDARRLLNALELLTQLASDADKNAELGRGEVKDFLEKQNLYDRSGDYHYDSISAFIKSLRGSDVDSALYWLQVMLQGGEQPRFIWRRLLILAAEDVGLADPQALVQVQAAAQAFEWVGLPEGEYFLSQATIYLALAPKSNSVGAFWRAKELLRKQGTLPVPLYLRGQAKSGARRESLRQAVKAPGDRMQLCGYLYPHNYSEHWVAQNYSERTLPGQFYQAGNIGWEQEFGRQHQRRLELLREARLWEQRMPRPEPHNTEHSIDYAARCENRHELLLAWDRLRRELVQELRQAGNVQGWSSLQLVDSNTAASAPSSVRPLLQVLLQRPELAADQTADSVLPRQHRIPQLPGPSADFLMQEWQRESSVTSDETAALLLCQLWNFRELLLQFAALPELLGNKPAIVSFSPFWQELQTALAQCSRPQLPRIYVLEEYSLFETADRPAAKQALYPEHQLLQIARQLHSMAGAPQQLAKLCQHLQQDIEARQQNESANWQQLESDCLEFCRLKPLQSWSIAHRQVLHERLWQHYARLLPNDCKELCTLWLDCYAALRDAQEFPPSCTLETQYCLFTVETSKDWL